MRRKAVAAERGPEGEATQTPNSMFRAAVSLAEAGRSAEAASLLAAMRKQFPFDELGFRGAILVAQSVGDTDALAALLAEARRLVPEALRITNALQNHWAEFSLADISYVSGALALAYLPARSRKSKPAHRQEVVRRLAMVCAAFPDDDRVFTHYADASFRSGATEDAIALVGAAAARFPKAKRLHLAWARLLRAANHPAEAALALQPLRQSAVKLMRPFAANVEALYIATLAEMGRFAEADQVATNVLSHSPDARPIWESYINSARMAGDLALAIDRSEAAQRVHPKYFGHLLRSLLLAHGADAGQQAAASPRDAALFAAFESLGSNILWGCEFGLVQRRFGTETLSLLRWSTIRPVNLIAALRARFDGVGSPAQTEVVAEQSGYQLHDKRFKFATHSFVSIDSMSIERMHGQACRRLGFLRNKLIEDLEIGDKIPVYKIGGNAKLDDVHELFSVLRGYGPVRLLCVALADSDNEAGSVREIEPGLFMGYVDHFYYKEGNIEVIDFANWRQVCQTVAVKAAIALPVDENSSMDGEAMSQPA
jgi:tetratricopeptide (TPR) repeat protein